MLRKERTPHAQKATGASAHSVDLAARRRTEYANGTIANLDHDYQEVEEDKEDQGWSGSDHCFIHDHDFYSGDFGTNQEIAP